MDIVFNLKADTFHTHTDEVIAKAVKYGFLKVDIENQIVTNKQGKKVGRVDRNNSYIVRYFFNNLDHVTTLRRIVYMMYIGNIPPLHRVFPKDPAKGVALDNLVLVAPVDKSGKIRKSRAKYPDRKLTDEQVISIRNDMREKRTVSLQEYSEKYEMTCDAVYRVIVGRDYEFIDGAVDFKLLCGYKSKVLKYKDDYTPIRKPSVRKPTVKKPLDQYAMFKFTPSQVTQFRNQLRETKTFPIKEFSIEHNMKPQSVFQMLIGKTYGHVPDPLDFRLLTGYRRDVVYYKEISPYKKKARVYKAKPIREKPIREVIVKPKCEKTPKPVYKPVMAKPKIQQPSVVDNENDEPVNKWKLIAQRMKRQGHI